jgi:hypothetical protein
MGRFFPLHFFNITALTYQGDFGIIYDVSVRAADVQLQFGVV